MRHLAVDIGANGGTAYVGRTDGTTLSVAEVHRFDNRPENRNDRYVWNTDRLLDGITAGLQQANGDCGPVQSVGIDAWGTDFGLFRDGDLVTAPYSYRDPNLTSTRELVLGEVDRRELFERTGISHWNATSTLWQYHYLATEEPELLERADRLQLMPQVLSTLLGGRAYCEPTIASTTQFLDPESGGWAESLLERVGVPTDLLPAVRPSERIVGEVSLDVASDFSKPPDIVVPASHDTAAAVAALPLDDDQRAFLSTGTWFIVGFELDRPNTSDAAFAAGASNELGVEDTVRFLRNVNGFFLLEECRESWRTDCGAPTYDDLLDAMARTDSFGPLVDPDDSTFGIEGDMPDKIRSYCERTDQRPPESRGAVVRCILESLAVKTALVLDALAAAADVSSDILHVGGGGVRNEPFCEMLAGATQQRVVAGPVEATAVGNLLGQARAYDEVESLRAGRRLVERSFEMETYAASSDSRWNDAKARMRRLPGGSVAE